MSPSTHQLITGLWLHLSGILAALLLAMLLVGCFASLFREDRDRA
ncbi:hypothetical protein VZQ01_17935 [Myxococcus faecalis]